jgi:hypothetical protein
MLNLGNAGKMLTERKNVFIISVPFNENNLYYFFFK